MYTFSLFCVKNHYVHWWGIHLAFLFFFCIISLGLALTKLHSDTTLSVSMSVCHFSPTPCPPVPGLWFLCRWSLQSAVATEAPTHSCLFSNSSISDPVCAQSNGCLQASASVFVRLWLSFSGQPYQAPVSNHFLASAIASRFDDCIWDGSTGSAVSGRPSLQSLLHTLSPYFLLWVFCSLF
jgi:hypothetical protein